MGKSQPVNYRRVHRELQEQGCSEEQIAIFFDQQIAWLAMGVKALARFDRNRPVPGEVRPLRLPLIAEHLVASVAGPLLQSQNPRVRTLHDLAHLNEDEVWDIPGIGITAMNFIWEALEARGLTFGMTTIP